jgi:predicted DNA-binding protein (MmcQ/YjbR family)
MWSRALRNYVEYDDIQPGHMSKTHWNTIALNESVSDALVKELIDHSYELICNSLPKKSSTWIKIITSYRYLMYFGLYQIGIIDRVKSRI